MGPQNRSTIWAVLTLIGLLALFLLSRAATVPAKARVHVQRITAVNQVRSVTMTLTNVSVPAAAAK